ncbi:MAG: DegT/DnrJ/EryC1/StrS family aminotransferase [Thermomicrobiales bacterium]|nr:DegT/DnrJ/EryC1/StrS family aminotransferase [Thermomicrobiales bacterium]
MNLAINGGTKAIPNPIGSAWPIWDDTEKTALIDVLESGRWGMAGWDFHRLPESKLVQFEQAFARYHDQEYGLAVSTGTVALEAALVALGVEVGDEVIVPAATYIASAACVARVNAIPILVDIDPATYTISPAAVEAAITSRTVAIIAVDLGGMPADTEVLRQIADRHGIALVSDCSHAQGSAFKGKKAGAWADISAYSIMSAKTFAVGEGGVICSNDADLIERCKSYQHMGRTPGAVSPDHVYPATTIRLSEWEAAIGLCALTRIEDQAQQRNHNVRYLGRQMDEMPGVKGLDIPNEVGVGTPIVGTSSSFRTSGMA